MEEYRLVFLEMYYLVSYTLDLFLSAENYGFVIYNVTFFTITSLSLVTLPCPKKDFQFQPSRQNYALWEFGSPLILTVVMIECIYLYVYLNKNNKVSSSHSYVFIRS